MHNAEPLHVTVSKVLPLEKWRVIRLLTKVWEFPQYVPTVKEASVVGKVNNTIKTRWKLLIDNIPINWVEEETLDLSHNTITFKATEGDLGDFQGEWKFEDTPQGTRVTANVFFSIMIPAMKDFVGPYLTTLVTKNFEAIIDSIERRLISTRYSSFKKGNKDKVAGFAIIGHPYNLSHMEKSFKMLNPGAVLPSSEFLNQLFHISPSFKLFDIPKFTSPAGNSAQGCFIIATFIPDMIERDMWTVFSKVVKSCKVAEKHGMGIVTLGGFTSIVGERIGHEAASEVDIAVTTGNTFTAAMALDGTEKAVKWLGKELADCKVAVIGGTGDIGSACCRVLANTVKQLTLTGRTPENLKKMNTELSRKRKAKIIATRDNKKAVRDADVVITATSATQAILDMSWFKPGAIICDVGYPKTISYSSPQREDIFVFSGGLAKSPLSIDLPIDLGLPAPDTLYGCFSEGIILDLEKRYENFSYGRGNITEHKINEIRELGKKHGFEVADFYWGHRKMDQAAVDLIKEKAGL